MIKFEVESTDVVVNRYPSKKTGEILQMVRQRVWAHIPGLRHPLSVRITLPDGVNAYPVGTYMLDSARSVSVNQWGELQFGMRTFLIPAQPVAQTSPSQQQRTA